MVGVSIKGRINARKILLIYFYEQYFLENTGKKEMLLNDIEKIYKALKSTGEEDIILKNVMHAGYYHNVDKEIAYIVNCHFKKFLGDDIDRNYIHILAPVFWKYQKIVAEKVNKYTVSFSYEEMDLIDRVLFVLGYIEFLLVKTPKKIVLNEMVELGKRYGDEKSSKLLNGIGHKLLTELED